MCKEVFEVVFYMGLGFTIGVLAFQIYRLTIKNRRLEKRVGEVEETLAKPIKVEIDRNAK